MARNDEISSTEKLLNLIRKQTSAPLPVILPDADIKSLSAKPSKKNFLGSSSKNVVIGVEIGYTELKLSKIKHLSNNKYELLNFATIPFAPNILPNSNGFASFLKDALTNFCGTKEKKSILWSAISSAKVETRCIRIPKLPRKQIPNAVFWVFTKEVPFNKEEEVLDFKILGDITEDGVSKMEVMTYTAPQKEIFDLRDLFVAAGYPLTGISIVPFAVQNLLQTILSQPSEKDICNLFIGRDWSRIAIYSEGKLVLSRGIKSGMRSMILCIKDTIKNKTFKESQLSLQAYKKIHTHLLSDKQDADETLARKIFFSFIRGALPISRVKNYNILCEDQVLEIILPALERLIRQVERTLEHYCQHFRNKGFAKVMVSGPLTDNHLIIKYLGRQLDLPITVMDPFASDFLSASRTVIPDSESKREAFVPAIGMGLSSNAMTPNFLFTHKDRHKTFIAEKALQAIAAASVATLIILTGIYLWQTRVISSKNALLASLSKELAQNSPEADRDLILKLFSRSRQQNDRLRAAIRRFTPVAVLEEISQVTPANIRLISCSAARTKERPSSFSVSLDGIIFGGPSTFDASLTNFMLRLKNSPLFSKLAVMEKKIEFYDNQEVLRFYVKLESA